MNSNFDAVKEKENLVNWIRDWFATNGIGCNAIVGISGGKDSTVTAALCAEALGPERVVGVLLPQGVQEDFDDAKKVCELLGIRYVVANIASLVEGAQLALTWSNASTGSVDLSKLKLSSQTKINLPARIRMTMLYGFSQSLNGRVANTCNLSENYIGYSTRYGDDAGDFSPLGNFTATEVVALGHELGLPGYLVDKVPADGLCGLTDEENFGFSYAVLDRYIKTGLIEDADVKSRIDTRHKNSAFKRRAMDVAPNYS